MSTIERPALGVQVTVGTLYDARKDTFLPTSPFKDGAPSNAANVTWQETKHVALCEDDTQQAKFRLFSLDLPLAASCLAGWVSLKGSGEPLIPAETGKVDEIYHALHYTRSTVIEDLCLDEADVRETIENAALGQEFTATHVVTQVLWGGSCSILATGCIPDQVERGEVSRKFAEASRKLEKFGSQELDLRTLLTVADDVLDPCLRLRGYADLLPQTGHSLTTLTQCKEHLEYLHDLAQTGYGDAVPIRYVLTPVSLVFKHSEYFQSTYGQLDPAHFQKILELYDSFGQVRRSLETHAKRLKKHRSSVRAEALVDVHDAIDDVAVAESKFKTEFSRLLSSVRARQALYKHVEDFIEGFSTATSSPQRFLSITTRSSARLDLLESLDAKGAVFVEYQAIKHQNLTNCYIFFFSDSAMKHPSWNANLDLVMRLLEDKASGASGASGVSVLAVDCDRAKAQLGKARVSKFHNGKPMVEDMVEHRKHEAGLSFIRFDQGSVDGTVKDAPSQRKPVRIPCPGQACTKEVRGWVCLKCRVTVEFALVDSYLYCECGRAPVTSATFNCQQGENQSYSRYPPKDLYTLLNALPTPPEINVLILGETGVGKSTFINSLINYLSFEKLDAALAAKDLNWIIPCSFATQSITPSGKLIQQEVQIGQDQDEHDGSKGQSATQQATVYPVYFGGGVIRLIDTPGIGDTRGPEQDRQNMINILQVLRNYEKLHGILILLKPNNARLTVMFKFCVKELLTQLHRNAAENMVFGFTNTRGSNYQAGDTFQPLEVLLKEYEDVIPGLFRQNVYCFDSESFRYLAARHKGIDMGHIDDYRRSWDHSSTEARRMVAYFQTKKPHEVKSTVSLNETRYLIAQLIQPMAQITTAIADTVKKSEKKIKDLKNTELSGNKLRAKLTTTKTIIDSTPLDKPRTVCSNSKCCSYTSDPSQAGAPIKLFKSMCHDPCNLPDVPPGIVGAKEIPPCAAFNGHEHCQVCSHHWQEHQHVIVEYSERTETTTDPMVQKALVNNADEASAKKVQIDVLENLIKELQDEHRMIQESQARFSHYLQQHSITHYNDATIEYYEHLIKDEKCKVSRGADRLRLEQLEEDKATYANFVDAMKRGKQSARRAALDEDGVYALVKDLYEMKHYGKNLKDCAKRTGQAYAATFRERPYRVRKRNAWGSSDEYDLFGSVYSQTTSSRDWRPSIKDAFKIKGPTPLRSQSTSEGSKSPKPPKPPKPEMRHSLTQRRPVKGPVETESQEWQHEQTRFSKVPYQESGDSDPHMFNDEKQYTLPPLNTQHPSSFGVKNHFLDEDAADSSRGEASPPPAYTSRKEIARSSTSQHGYPPIPPLPGGRLGYGGVIPVMLNSGDPEKPYGPGELKRGKSKLLSGWKSKLTKRS